MHIRDFSPHDYPALVEIHRRQQIVWPERPLTAEAWADADRHRNPKCRYHRWVALEDEHVVGFASYGQDISDYHPQKFYIAVEVLPEFQRQGIGAALYDRLMDGLQPFDPRVLRADAFENLPQGFPFLARRGFHEIWRETPVHLDVTAFDVAPYAGLEDRLRAQGITITTASALRDDPDRDWKLYDLYHALEQDLPREEGEMLLMGFEDWQWGFNDPTTPHDAYFVARCGEDYIGLKEMGQEPGSRVLQGGLMGVRPAYRQRGLGLAMQLRAIGYAREHGCDLLKSCTGAANAPMQALFTRLGYHRDPEWLQCEKIIA